MLTADEIASLTIGEFKYPRPNKEQLVSVLETVGYSMEDAKAAIEKYYPTDMNRYAVSIKGDNQISAPFVSQYNVGNGDFAVEAWVSTTCGGTIISRKPTSGCIGNGGFLLVIKRNGVIKLATDDGYGFYEINTEPVINLFDGKFHHFLGLRKDAELEIYVDFLKISSTVRTNSCAGLNINNSIRLAVGFTDQIQEEYNYFIGLIGEIRMWSTAKTYADINEWKNSDYVMPGLIGMWTFNQKSGEDYSGTNNRMDLQNTDFEIMEQIGV